MKSSPKRNPQIGDIVRFARVMKRGVVEAPLWSVLELYHYGHAGTGKLTHIHEGDTFLVLDVASPGNDSERWYKIHFKEGVWWLGWWDQLRYSRATAAELEVISKT